MNNNLQSLIIQLESSISPNPKNNMKRVSKAIKHFDIDFTNTKKIHVAGTNGKGSVSKYLTQILTDSGFKVGTFVSPYLKVFNERILLNNQLITDEDLEKYLKIVLDYNKKLEENMSFFELLTVLSFLYFYNQEVDVIIIEVGIGGKLDVTNTINYDLSLLTNVGTDHIDKLGPTASDVLSNKLGILKEGGLMITTLQEEYRLEAIKYSKSINATMKFVDKPLKLSNNPLSFYLFGEEFKLKMLGDFQLSNAALAITAAKRLFPSLKLADINKSISNVYWPGRLDLVKKNPTIYVDAAHNKEAAIALVEAIKSLYEGNKIVFLMSILRGKDYNGFINELSKVASEIILTDFPDPRLADLELISKEFEKTHYIKDFNEAVSNLKDPDTIYVVTGSIHFIGYFLNNY